MGGRMLRLFLALLEAITDHGGRIACGDNTTSAKSNQSIFAMPSKNLTEHYPVMWQVDDGV